MWFEGLRVCVAMPWEEGEMVDDGFVCTLEACEEEEEEEEDVEEPVTDVDEDENPPVDEDMDGVPVEANVLVVPSESRPDRVLLVCVCVLLP